MNKKDAKMSTPVKKKKKKKLSAEEKAQRKAQTTYRNEIRTIMNNLGLQRIPGVDGKHFTYDERKTELDDIFFYQNIIILTEYTLGDPKEHLLAKNYFYNKVIENKPGFIDFLIDSNIYEHFSKKYNDEIKMKYTKNQLQIVVMYCSKKTIQEEHKKLVNPNISFLDYHIVKYFSSLTKIIKKSAKYEFFDFLNIPANKMGDAIRKSTHGSHQNFSGHILPEEHSSFDAGYKIISFYIDANNLLKRAYVLRQNGWRDPNGIGHYQRMLIQAKIQKMRKYLHEQKRVFINNIIATIALDKVKLYDENNQLIILNNKGEYPGQKTEVIPTTVEIEDEINILGIIDGQHRTFSYHEGDDPYENSIKNLREIQNLLITGILFPRDVTPETRLKFEANLFMEINSNQSGASSQLKQEIELMLHPLSTISVAKKVLDNLSKSGPLSDLLEIYWYEKGKLKTTTIVSYGLRPLLKIDDEKSSDSIYYLWNHKEKKSLKDKGHDNSDLLHEYITFAITTIRNLLIPLSRELGEKWCIADRKNNGILTVTTINGILNMLRKMIENNKVMDDNKAYENIFAKLNDFDFKKYKSSTYREMGIDMYNKVFS